MSSLRFLNQCAKLFFREGAINILFYHLKVYAIHPAQVNRRSVTFVSPYFKFALEVEYNGSFKTLIVCDGLDVCGPVIKKCFGYE